MSSALIGPAAAPAPQGWGSWFWDRAATLTTQTNTFLWTGNWQAVDAEDRAGLAGGVGRGLQGGASITASEFTGGLTDWAGITNSTQYQGWEFDASRVSAAIGREALLTAVGGAAARSGNSLLRATSRTLDAADFGSSAYSLGSEAGRAYRGEGVDWVNAGTSALGVAGPIARTAIPSARPQSVAPSSNFGPSTERIAEDAAKARTYPYRPDTPTTHAMERMATRGVSWDSVQEAVRNGVRTADPQTGVATYKLPASLSSTGRGVNVVRNEIAGKIITVIDRGSR